MIPLRNPQVEGRPIVAVAVAIAIFAMLGDNRWRKLPVFAQRQNTVGRKAQRFGVFSKIAIAAGLPRLGAQSAAVLQGALRYAWRQAVEPLFIVIRQHRIVAVLRRIIAAQGVAAGRRRIIL